MHELLTIKDILVSLEMRLTSVVVLECGNRNAGTALRACLDANANAANGGGVEYRESFPSFCLSIGHR